FNAATADPPWRTVYEYALRTRMNVLQCGHGGSAVENPDPAGHGVPDGLPSMRPRRIRRGEPSARPARPPPTTSFNAATADPPWRTALLQDRQQGTEPPSMRPRRIRRGEHRRAAPPTKHSPPFNPATADPPWRTSPPSAGSRPYPAFNAATADPPTW